MSTAAHPKTRRQPPSSAIRPLTVLASRTPSSTPLMTIPITVPRSSSRASVAANGMSSCAPTEVTPTTTSAIAIDGQRRRGRGARQRERRDDEHARDVPAALDHVAERHERDDPDEVAELRERHDEAGRLVDTPSDWAMTSSSGWA